MAWEHVTLARLERVAAKLKEAGEKIARSIDMAKSAGLTELVFQIRDAEKCADGASTSANRAELHIPDQVECVESGATPLWRKSQIRSALNRARNEARGNVEAQALVKRPTGRKAAATKKAPTRKAAAKAVRKRSR